MSPVQQCFILEDTLGTLGETDSSKGQLLPKWFALAPGFFFPFLLGKSLRHFNLAILSESQKLANHLGVSAAPDLPGCPLLAWRLLYSLGLKICFIVGTALCGT